MERGGASCYAGAPPGGLQPQARHTNANPKLKALSSYEYNELKASSERFERATNADRALGGKETARGCPFPPACLDVPIHLACLYIIE